MKTYNSIKEVPAEIIAQRREMLEKVYSNLDPGVRALRVEDDLDFTGYGREPSEAYCRRADAARHTMDCHIMQLHATVLAKQFRDPEILAKIEAICAKLAPLARDDGEVMQIGSVLANRVVAAAGKTPAIDEMYGNTKRYHAYLFAIADRIADEIVATVTAARANA